MTLLDTPPFDPEPRTQAEFLRAIWERLGRVERKQDLTNGRVTHLERLALFIGGAAVAYGFSIVAPLLPPFVAALAR